VRSNIRRCWRSHSPKEISSGALWFIDIQASGLPCRVLKCPLLISICITFWIHFGVM
jgi:hypothetical protein